MADPSAAETDRALQRWRLVLGRFADEGLGAGLTGDEARLDAALEFLYGREYAGRGARDADRTGSLDSSRLTVADWLREVRELFPRETVEIVERHALERYGMSELVTDPAVLERLEPNYELLRAILTFKGLMTPPVLDLARRVVREVVEDLRRRLVPEVRRAFAGRIRRHLHSRRPLAQNFDWRRTVRANLRHYDPARRRLIIAHPQFFARVEHHLPWHVILAVDQSGSMTDSVIHSAVMAGILAGLPALRVSLIVFDTSVVDLTGYIDDPVEALMRVQLGGGTDIGQAVAYCETLLDLPARTVVVLVTDFFEGGAPERLVAGVRRLREAGARVLGLAALELVCRAGLRPADGRAPGGGGRRDRRAYTAPASRVAGRGGAYVNPAAYTALSEDALAALANRGLLRRAAKDLEREPPTVVAEDAAALTLAFATDACTVTLTEAGAQAARCTCPAGGVCRHILAGILFVQAGASAAEAPDLPEEAAGPAAPVAPEAGPRPPAAAAPAPGAAAAAVSPAALKAWAGRTVYRQGESDLATSPALAVEETPALLTLGLESGETVYWPAGGDLAATICSCGQPAPCRHRVAAILAYQARRAGVEVAAPATLPEVSAATADARGALLAGVAVAVEDLVAAGLTRLGAPAEGHLRTLAVSAHSLDLPRLEHLLRALADHVAWQLRRDVRADAAGLLAAAAQVYALAAALAAAGPQPPRALAGTHRDAYAPLGPIEVVGLGAQAWRTRSGYAGLSVFFWEPAARRRLVWSDSRPAFYNGVRFDPAERYRAPGAWEDSAPPDLVAGSRLRLTGARRTPGGRLSAHPGTRVTVLGPADLAACDLTGLAFADWRALAEYLAALPGAGPDRARSAGRPRRRAARRLGCAALRLPPPGAHPPAGRCRRAHR